MKELIEIQTELKAPKEQYNNFGKYKYRSCEDILEALKPLLFKHKCCLTINDSVELVGNRFYIKSVCKLTNSEKEVIETSAFAREPEAKKGIDESQITGAASSYARKYALNGMFAIDDSKDADSTNTHAKDNKDNKDNKKVTWKDELWSKSSKELKEKLVKLNKEGLKEESLKTLYKNMEWEDFENVILISKSVEEVNNV